MAPARDAPRWCRDERDQGAHLLLRAARLVLDRRCRLPVLEGRLAPYELARVQVNDQASFLPVVENIKGTKFADGAPDGKHYWLTPPDLYARLSAEFGPFDFDPCPYPLPEGFDGLTCEWGRCNYVNPPFGSVLHHGRKKGPTAWARKAVEEYRKGKTVVLVYPIDKWVLMLLEVLGAKVLNLGDVHWLATEDRTAGNGTGRHVAAFILDSRESQSSRK